MSASEIFIALSVDLLGQGFCMRFRPKGRSMHPTIKEGEMVTVAPIEPGDVKRGDIILYKACQPERFVIAHRVVKVNKSKDNKTSFILRGDASQSEDAPISPEQVLGRLVSVERKGRQFSLTGNRAKQLWINGGYMKKVIFFLTAAFCLLVMNAKAKAQVPILYYDFENNTNRSAFENAVEQAMNGGSGAVGRVGGTSSGVSGAGTANGGPATGQSITGSSWQTGSSDPGVLATDYYEFVVNTGGFAGITVDFNCQASGTGPLNVGLLYSVNGILFTAAASQTTGTTGAWNFRTFDLTAATAINNQSSVTIRIYGYNANASGAGTFRIDNLEVLANSTVAGAGTKTTLDEFAIFTSTTSGSTGSVFLRTNFTVSGSGTKIILGSQIGISGMLLVASDTTFSFGPAFTAVIGTGAFTLNSGAALEINSASGITSSVGEGNVQVTGTRTFNSGASYAYIRNAAGAQATGNQLPANISGSFSINLGAGADSPLTLTQDTTVSGTLALTNGKLSTGANTLTVSNPFTGAITGGGGASYIIGGLKRAVALGVYSFPVGTANGYSPVTNDVTSVDGAQDFTVSAANVYMTGVTDTTKAIQRTWTLSTTATAAQIESNLTFQFVAGAPPGGDIPATVDTATLDALRRNADGTINRTPAFSRTPNSVTVININTFSEWTLANTGAAPTAVECVSFNAYSDDKGRVFIQWQTGFEVNNLGFNIYRDEGGKRARINPSLVAGSALLAGARTVLTAGGSYVWFDSLDKTSDFVQYWLEDVDLNGKRTMRGPISPTFSAKLPAQAESPLLAKLQSASQTSATEQQPGALDRKPFDTSLQAQWDIASRHAVKIAVRKEGWHRVTQPQLIAAGLDPAANPQLLQLFADGRELPILVTGQHRPRLDPSDSIEFFATALDTASTDIHTYYLVVGSAAGRRIRFVQGGNGKPTAAQSFPFTVERKERSIYFAALKNGDAENFFGPIVSSEPITQSLTLHNLAPSAIADASLEITLQGATDDPGSATDHNVRVLLNGSDIGAISFDGQSRKTMTLSAPSGLLREGKNIVTLTAMGGEMDLSLLDRIRLTYSHAFAADDDALRFPAPGQESVRVAGFSSPKIRVIDVTDPDNVQELRAIVEPFASGFAARVTPQDAGQRTLLAFTDSEINQPASAIANLPSSWNRAGQLGDLIIITHHSFIEAARPLQALRQRQGLTVSLVDIEDLYDEFSYGARSPQAVKDFLARAKATWKKPPRYVLLAGDASFDPKNYLGFGDSDFVLTKLVETDFLETASDDWFVDFNSDSLPDLAIGRLPARTAGEAATMVTKIIGYETAPRAESLLLVADRNEDFNFEAADDQLRPLVPANLRVNEIRRGRIDDITAKSRVIEMINEGQKIVNYAGHGSVEVWRGNLLTSADAAELTNTQQLSLFVTMTCLNAYFHDLATSSLAEALMKSENGGAVAVWASASLTEPAEQARMNQELYRLLLGSGDQMITIGEAAARAKAITANRDIRRSWIFFGDPTTKLK